MNIFSVGAFSISFANIILWLLTLTKRNLSKLAKSYFWWSLFITLWAFGYGITLSGFLPYNLTLLWNKWCQSMAAMIGPFFFHFACTLVGSDKRYRALFSIYTWVGAIIATTMFATPFYVKALWSFDVCTYQPLGGPLYIIFVAFFLWCTIHGFIVALINLPRMAGKVRTQLIVFLVSSAIGYTGGATLFLQAFKLPVPSYGVFSILIYVIAVAYSIHRYQFLDIPVLVRRTVLFALLLSSILALVTIITYLLQSTFGASVPRHIAQLISIGLSLLVVDPLRSILVKVTDRFLFQKGYSYDEIEDEVASCSEITDLKQLSQRIVEIFFSKMALESAALMLHMSEENTFQIMSSAGLNDLSEKMPARMPALASIVNAHDKALRLDDPQKLGDALQSIRLIVKLSHRSELIALLFLGKKKSDKDYSNDDIRFFEITSKHIANMINVAKTFHFQRDFYALQAEKNRSDMLTQLSGGLDHEIKNPLNQSMPRIELIRLEAKRALENRTCDPYALLAKVVEHAEVAYKHEKRIVAITDLLRRFSRPIPEREQVQLKPLSLLSNIREAIALISETRFHDDNVIVECTVANDATVLADEILLVQCLHNVINNAYHAINRHGTITISASPLNDGSMIRISVTDTGHGIKPEHKDKIFQPFFTTKPTNPQGNDMYRFKGTGLGLSLVKRYMEECRGNISFKSEVGRGATFFLDFVKADVNQPSSAK